MSTTVSRGRQHNVDQTTYNPDLEYSQQAYANEMYGRGSPTGSYGMTGGQYPTVGNDRPGFGTGTYGNPWGKNFAPGGAATGIPGRAVDTTGGGNIYPGGAGGTATGGGGGYGQPSTAAGGFNYYGSGDPYAGGASGARQQFGTEASNLYSGLIAGAGSEGYTPEQQQLIRTSGDVAARAPYERARFDIARRAGLTGDSASVAASRAALAPAESASASDAARTSDMGIMNEAERRRELALQMGGAGLTSLYGTETGYNQGLLSGRAGLASLVNRKRTEGTSTGGSGGVNMAAAVGA